MIQMRLRPIGSGEEPPGHALYLFGSEEWAVLEFREYQENVIRNDIAKSGWSEWKPVEIHEDPHHDR